ncbi:MAG: MBL fold metallo-hydrolase [Myxococcales bacterium]|nr:MBL fold metallo-hydrolase [Myxococcales bacterium]
MQITALGHSCVLLDLDGEQPTRILVDPWLSDHAVGDGMGRFPRVRFAAEDLAPHAVYLTHGHCDHLDPYTLVRLWRELEHPPVLILPATLALLVPVFREHLPGVRILVLQPHEPVIFRGVELLGFYDVSPVPTNEDDVMVLVVTNGDERVLVEADANLSLDDPELRAFVSHLMREPGITSSVFLTTENELTATLASRSCRTLEDREALVDQARDELLEAVHALYAPVDDPDDLWQGEHVVRLIHGQGLTAPHELDPRWQHILFPVRIEHRVREERAAAEAYGCRHTIDALTVGAVHRVEGGRVVDRTPEPALTLLDAEEARTYDPDLAFFPELPCAPIRGGERDVEAQRTRIEAVLNGRFLPYLAGSRQPPLIHLLAAYGGSYTVRVVFGDEPVDFTLGFGAHGFVAGEPGGEPQEAWWADDLEDFLDGRCDAFSGFCREPFPDVESRLWACLGMPLLDGDLLLKRTALHFERASAGLSPESWVLPLYA